jgi:D-psicose/D-tagatose/L-ribulose 3-epimerase
MVRAVHRFGVIVPSALAAEALALGADHVEPPIVGNVVVAGPDGGYGPAPDFVQPRPATSFALLFPGEVRIADPRVPIATIAEYLSVAFDAAAAVAEPDAKIVLGSGTSRTIPDDVDRAAGEARFAEVLRTARDLAAERRLRIVLEPLNRTETNLLHTMEDCAAFLDREGIDGIGIVADLFHVMIEAESFDTVRGLGARIGHVHLSDEDREPPGTGDWPIAEFLAAVRAGGYEGSASIECHWTDFAAQFPEALAFVRSADVTS